MSFFLHGVHVPHRKNTADQSATRLNEVKTVTIPMSMHIGAPASPIVKVGDLVEVGTKIADAVGAVSSPIHASVSGKVTPDMLPPEWDTARKQVFLNDLATRRKKSKWALLILIPMIAVFGFEMLELYVFPPLGAILAALGFTVGA